jgi:carnitine monooxygenase subunit
MKHETQIETLETLLKLREEDRDQEVHKEVVHDTLHSYTEPDILEREMTTLFQNYPMVAGHVSSMREPGTYMLSDWNNFPYVIIRDKEGSLRAFLNICRHRGARLVSGHEKQIKSFVCPYHGWVYDLDGSLKSVTKSYNFPGIDCNKYSLKEIPVVEHKGLIWIHPTPGASIDLSSYLGAEIDTDFDHFEIDQLMVHRKSTIMKKANWKLLLKTYLDRYHVPILHRNSIAGVFEKGVIAHFEHNPHIRIAAARSNLQDALQVDRTSWRILEYASVFYTLFPNTFLIMHSNIASINSFYPVTPDQTIWTHEMLYRESDYKGELGQENLAKRFENINTVFDQEDFGIAEDIQMGLSHCANEFHTLGLEEGLLAIFQENIDRLLV